MIPLLSALSPTAAILLLTVGLALIALELNRPGSILPGATGLLLTLLATASLAHLHPHPAVVVLLVLCLALLLLQLRRSLHWILAAAATLGLIFALLRLLPADQPQPSPIVAILCGLILGAGTTVLTRIARRARLNKGLD